MQLLIWHEALGSDDEQATEDELCARVLYAQGESELGGEAVLSGERLLQSLHLVQGLLAFVRMLRAKKSETYRTSANWTPEWASVTLSRRRFFVLEVEPRIFMTLAVHPAMEIKDHRAAYEALLQDLYGLFRLFHGTIDSNLRVLAGHDSEQNGVDLKTIPEKQYADGMDLLMNIGAARKRLRKLRHAIETHNQSDDVAGESEQLGDNAIERLQEEKSTMEAELEMLMIQSPAVQFQRRCGNFFPKLLQGLDINGSSAFSELQGLGYFPMDQATFLSLQSFVNDFHAEFKLSDPSTGIDGVESSALFFKGNLLWSSMEISTMHLLYKFLRLREERGMNMECRNENTQPSAVIPSTKNEADLWMAKSYEDTFLPVWSSKLSYTECDAVSQTHNGTSHVRRMSRSLHKQRPASLSTFLSDAPSSSRRGSLLSPSSVTTHSPSSPFSSPSHSRAVSAPLTGRRSDGASAGLAQAKSAIKARTSSVLFRNAGLLLKNGYFSKLLQTTRESAMEIRLQEAESVWSPPIFPLADKRSSDSPEAAGASTASQNSKHRVVLWHEADLTMVLILRTEETSINLAKPKSTSNLPTLERLEVYFDSQQRFQNLAQLISTRYDLTFAPEKNMPNLHPSPPFLYLNRVNLAFRMQQVPRLLKGKENDLFPIPAKLLAHYLPASTMALVNELHAELQGPSSAGNREICVRTRYAGWVLAKKSETSHRELYVFFDSKISSVHDLTDSLQSLLQDQFGNVLF